MAIYTKPMILLIRANHANEFELQNYSPIAAELGINVITSLHPLTPISLPSKQLWSPTDLPKFPFRRQILNRLMGGEQWLLGLDAYLANQSNGSNHLSIAHTAETYTPYTHQAVQLRKSGKLSKLICTCWETIAHSNEKFGVLRHWKSEAYQYVDLFHTPTVRAKQALVEEGVDPVKIVVIPYGLDLTHFSTGLPGDSLQGKRQTVLTVARLEKEKGVEDLELVARALPQYDFVLVGHGRYSPSSPNLKIISAPYSQMPSIYQSSDLFFLPSCTTPTWEEQYGMALVEAMACGLPIITTRSGAIPEVVGEAGILVPEKNVDKMVRSITDLLSNPDQCAHYRSLSISRATTHFDRASIAQSLRALYL